MAIEQPAPELCGPHVPNDSERPEGHELCTHTKLSVIFLLEYVVQGAWPPLLSLYMKVYLKFNGI